MFEKLVYKFKILIYICNINLNAAYSAHRDMSDKYKLKYLIDVSFEDFLINFKKLPINKRIREIEYPESFFYKRNSYSDRELLRSQWYIHANIILLNGISLRFKDIIEYAKFKKFITKNKFIHPVSIKMNQEDFLLYQMLRSNFS